MNDTLTDTGINVGYQAVIDRICALNWEHLDRDGISAIAWAYYYFSVQFRENLEIAYRLHPHDPALAMLMGEECATDNLSPWPEVAIAGEALDHDEFMRRSLKLVPIDGNIQQRVEAAGSAYLARVRAMDEQTRAMSIASYEDGGLESVFRAILHCHCWDTPLLEAFRHFLIKHISFDSNPNAGHGALVRHLVPDERILDLWSEFQHLFIMAAPELASVSA